MSCCEENICNEKKQGDCSKFFPNNIEALLRKLVCECVVLTYRSGCKEKVKIECISGDLLVAKEEGCLKLININCICAVAAPKDVVLGALISPFGCCD